MTQIPARPPKHAKMLRDKVEKITGEYVALTPDFPFDYRTFLETGSTPIGQISDTNRGNRVAIIGSGVAGMIAAYEAMRMGLIPVLFEANNRIGGRFYTERFEGQGDPATLPIAELGAMRFSQYSKTIIKYFEKTGMWSNTGPFPNPGTGIVPGNLVDYKGQQSYYVVDPATGNITDGSNPFDYLSDQFYGTGVSGTGLMERNGFTVSDVWDYQTAPAVGDPIPEAQQQALKDHWNDLVRGTTTHNGQSCDTKSFRDLLTDDNWNFDDIEKFGQVGFGTGGWGTDYIDSSLELIRTIYMALDTDQFLMLDGADALPNRMYQQSPTEFGDQTSGYINPSSSVAEIQVSEHTDGSPFGKEVVGFVRNNPDLANETISVSYRQDGGAVVTHPTQFDAVVYTPHVRVLDKMRFQSGSLELQKSTTELFDADTWESIMYTHYQQSTKIFQSVDAPFWNNIDTGTGQYEMSQTLSDKLTRGTYLVDYASNNDPSGNKGAGIFTSYTWADDSTKYLSTDNDVAFSSWKSMTASCLNQIYDRDDVFLGHADGMPSAAKKWDDDPHFICAFKYNLPGNYKYQRTLFQNFYCGAADEANVTPDTRRFILAGDGISWTAAWAEGAAQSGVNAVAKLEYLFNGNVLNPDSPHGQYEKWMPIDFPDLSGPTTKTRKKR